MSLFLSLQTNQENINSSMLVGLLSSTYNVTNKSQQFSKALETDHFNHKMSLKIQSTKFAMTLILIK